MMQINIRLAALSSKRHYTLGECPSGSTKDTRMTGKKQKNKKQPKLKKTKHISAFWTDIKILYEALH